MSASIGISIYPDNAQSSKSLLIASDKAMYEAKKSEDTNIIFY
jgi:GGDEF domain-containing protein